MMAGVTRMTVAPTADLSTDEVTLARRLLAEAFEGRFDDHHWEHALGGLHVLITDAGRLVGHAAVVRRQLLLDDRPLRCGYVEAVAVAATHRGRGHGAELMAEVERLIRGGYELGALSAGERVEGFYTGRGWRRWAGPTAVVAPSGVRRTPEEDGSTYVLTVMDLGELTGVLACDWRLGDVW